MILAPLPGASGRQGAIYADGTGLQQLTRTQGFTRDAGGTTVEMVFPWAYPGLQIFLSGDPLTSQ